jgi:LPXTG-site transpeptidase (sortase) family protein
VALNRGARWAAQQLGEVALAGVLGAALVFTASDGTPQNGGFDFLLPAPTLRTAVAGHAGAGNIRPPNVLSDSIFERPVPTAAPAVILIPSLDVHRPIEPVGTDRSGHMDLPQNLWNAGWYKGGPVPGAPGDAVIEGHAGYPTAPLLFGKLRLLRAGDKIVVVLADGSRQLFVVDSLTVWAAGTGPPGMGEPYGPARLTLITCTGPFDDHYKTYADRLAVEASYAGPA